MDPAKVTEYMAGADQITDVQRLPNGGYKYTTLVKIAGLRIEITSEDIEVVPNERVVSKMESVGMDASSTVRLERLEGGKTRAILVGETNLHAGPLAKLGEAFLARYFDHSMEMSMATVKARLEAEQPAATRS
jgi:hypothetical protein